MNPLYNELQPSDVYCVRLPYPFSDFDRQILTALYQPLIGHGAMAVFFALWGEAEREGTVESTHYHLLNLLDMPIGSLFDARLSLEGIGLMKSYRKKQGEGRSFLYELKPPLDPDTFFHDPILSMFLFGKVGAQTYKRLKGRFLNPTVPEGYEEVSRSFPEVYKSVKAGSMEEDTDTYESDKRSPKLAFSGYPFDFVLMMEGLSAQLVPRKAFTPAVKEMIVRIAFLYGLSPIDMQQVVLLAIDADGHLTEDRLKRAGADFYKLSRSNTAPKVTKITSSPEKSGAPKEPQTKDDELIVYLETRSPVEMLKDINDGRDPMQVDVKLAQKLVLEHSLPAGVVNVLLQYVLLRNDGKLTNNYVERIASHWMAKKVDNVRDALELARTEHDKYMKWKHEGGGTRSTRKPGAKTEAVPDWFYRKENKDKEKGEQKPPKQQEGADPEVEARRIRLMEKFGMTKGGVN